MERRFVTLLIIIIFTMLSLNNLESMEEKNAANEAQEESLWERLPYEVQLIVLSYVGLDNATDFDKVLDKLKILSKQPMFSSLLDDKIFIRSLAKKYAEKNKGKIEDDFFSAIYSCNLPVVQGFIDGRVDVNIQQQSGDKLTALSRAVVSGCKDIIEFLLDKGANVNALGGSIYTALLFAADRSGGELYRDIMQILLNNGANPNIQDSLLGHSPLMLAIEEGSIKAVQILIDAGANVNAEDLKGRTILRYAKRKNQKIFNLLQNAGAK